MSDQFKNLNNALGTDYIPEEPEEIKVPELTEGEKIKEMEDQLASLQNQVHQAKRKKTETYQDAEYMKAEISNVLASTKYIMDMLEQTIKVGAAPQYFEKYSFLLNSCTNLFREYRQVSRDVADVSLAERRLALKEQDASKSGNTINNNLIMMDSKSLLDFVNKATTDARDVSNMRQISTDFVIDERETER